MLLHVHRREGHALSLGRLGGERRGREALRRERGREGELIEGAEERGQSRGQGACGGARSGRDAKGSLRVKGEAIRLGC